MPSSTGRVYIKMYIYIIPYIIKSSTCSRVLNWKKNETCEILYTKRISDSNIFLPKLLTSSSIGLNLLSVLVAVCSSAAFSTLCGHFTSSIQVDNSDWNRCSCCFPSSFVFLWRLAWETDIPKSWKKFKLWNIEKNIFHDLKNLSKVIFTL